MDQINNQIASNKVMMYSKSFCPHCNAAKQLLKSQNIEFTAIELDQVANGDAIQKALQQKTNQRTVPNIFIAG